MSVYRVEGKHVDLAVAVVPFVGRSLIPAEGSTCTVMGDSEKSIFHVLLSGQAVLLSALSYSAGGGERLSTVVSSWYKDSSVLNLRHWLTQ